MARTIVELKAEEPDCRFFVDVQEDRTHIACVDSYGRRVIHVPSGALQALSGLIVAAASAHSVAAVRPPEDPERQKPPRFQEIRRKHPRAYTPWTREDESRLESLTRQGIPIAQIALELQRQPSAIRSRMERSGSAKGSTN